VAVPSASAAGDEDPDEEKASKKLTWSAARQFELLRAVNLKRPHRAQWGQTSDAWISIAAFLQTLPVFDGAAVKHKTIQKRCDDIYKYFSNGQGMAVHFAAPGTADEMAKVEAELTVYATDRAIVEAAKAEPSKKASDKKEKRAEDAAEGEVVRRKAAFPGGDLPAAGDPVPLEPLDLLDSELAGMDAPKNTPKQKRRPTMEPNERGLVALADAVRTPKESLSAETRRWEVEDRKVALAERQLDFERDSREQDRRERREQAERDAAAREQAHQQRVAELKANTDFQNRMLELALRRS